MSRYVYIPFEARDSMQHMKESDLVTLVTQYPPYKKVYVKRVTKMFVELEGGRKFSKTTGREMKSEMCSWPEHSDLFIDSRNDYWAENQAKFELNHNIILEMRTYKNIPNFNNLKNLLEIGIEAENKFKCGRNALYDFGEIEDLIALSMAINNYVNTVQNN